jgi:omega-6 fatty acid desaturase (delta-12 desaturase)
MQLGQYRAKSGRAWFEVSVTLVPYIVGLSISSILFKRNLIVFIVSTFVTALFSVRLFSIFHDCSHRSFHPNKTVCLWLGRVCGFLSGFAPFSDWSRTHLSHHTNLNNLDLKLPGDILTYTLSEFRALSPARKFAYRIYRHPVFLLGMGGITYFLIYARVPWFFPKETRRSIWATNVGVLIFVFAGCAVFGTKSFLAAQLLILWISTVIGVGIFYIHHQFEDAYFSRGTSWRVSETSLNGSSYFRFPPIVQWVTMNIGYHHVHHLHPTIPGYHLPEVTELREKYALKRVMGLKDILQCFRLKLYCEESSKLRPFFSDD